MLRRKTTLPKYAGYSLVEVVIVVGLVGLLFVAVLPVRDVLQQWSLSRATRITERVMTGTRLRAVAHREKLRVVVSGRGTLEILDGSGRVVNRFELAGPGRPRVDSVRIRPRTIRYNARGHGAAGSITLYLGNRGKRVISNFLGRIRRHSFRF